MKPTRTNEERMDRLWQIAILLCGASFDLMERLSLYEPELRGELAELAILHRRIVQKARHMLEKEGVENIDERIADKRARFEANPLGLDIVGQESEPWELMLPRRKAAQ